MDDRVSVSLSRGSRVDRVIHAHVHLLESIARSQAALASLLEQLIQGSEQFGLDRHSMLETLRSLSIHQEDLCMTLTDWKKRIVPNGSLDSPRLRDECWIREETILHARRDDAIEEDSWNENNTSKKSTTDP